LAERAGFGDLPLYLGGQQLRAAVAAKGGVEETAIGYSAGLEEELRARRREIEAIEALVSDLPAASRSGWPRS